MKKFNFSYINSSNIWSQICLSPSYFYYFFFKDFILICLFSDFMLRILDAEEPSESKINWNYPEGADSVGCNFTCFCLFFSLSVLIHFWPFTWAFPPVVRRRRRLALGHEEAAVLFVFIWEETGETNRKRWAVIPTEQIAPARSERRTRASKWNVAETLRERSVRHLMKQRRGDAAASDWNGAKTKHLMGASGAAEPVWFFLFSFTGFNLLKSVSELFRASIQFKIKSTFLYISTRIYL